MSDLFLGQSIGYWLELQRRMNSGEDSLERTALLNEVVQLRGKVAFYESRIRQMVQEAAK